MKPEPLPFSNKGQIGIMEDGVTKVAAIDDLRRRFGVAGLVRLHLPEFEQLPGPRSVFVHFNLE